MLAVDLRIGQLDPGLARERAATTRSTATPDWDRRFILAGAAISPLWMVLMALDARRFAWSHLPLGAAVLGGLLMTAGTAIAYAGLRANSFASTVVRLQSDRGQRVVDRGPYAVVRHPIYLGFFLTSFGAPLVLGSAWGLAGTVLLIVLTIRRAVREERFLADQLPGYRAYLGRVRWRFMPGIS